jgi:hypothetical protein
MIAILPVDGLTISAALRRAVERRPDSDALVFPKAGVRFTYAQYDARVDEVARSLLALDVKRGDHVAVWATNWPDWTLLLMATVRVGAVLVTVKSCLPDARAGVRAAPVRHQGPFPHRSLQVVGLLRHDRRGARQPPPASLRGLHEGAGAPGDPDVARLPRAGTHRPDRPGPPARGEGGAGGSREPPVHVRHDGLSQGRAPVRSEHPAERVVRGRSPAGEGHGRVAYDDTIMDSTGAHVARSDR